MTNYLLFLLLGTGVGAVYAAIGIGLVLTHRASGVVNLAHGALAMYATYVFSELRSTGDLVVPVVGLPSRVHLVDRPPLGVALVLAVTAAALLGLVLHALVFGPLRSSPLAGLVASVGIGVTLQAVAVLQFGPGNRAVPAVLPARPLSFAGVTVPSDRLILAALAVGAAGALWAVARFTRLGLAARAASENRLGAMLCGWSPGALAAGSWAVAGALGAVAGILVGPITQLNPATYTLLVVPALAAALVGRLSSFGVTVAAGLGLGMAQSLIVGLQDRYPALPRVGLAGGLPLVVILVLLAVRGHRPGPIEPPTGVGTGLPAATLPARARPVGYGAVAVTAAALFLLPGPYRLGLINSMVAAVVCLSLVVLTGYAGQVSLAQMTFAGIAGFTLSRLTQDLGLPFPLAPLLSALLAGVAGLAVGVPALRVRGANLALVTIAAAVAVEEVGFKNASLAGGFAGARVPPPALGGLDLGIAGRAGAGPGGYPRPVFGLLVLAVLAVSAVAVAGLRRRRWGRRMLAVRANEMAAAALGVDVAATRLVAFGLSAFLAGLAGTLVGYQQGRVSVESFGVFLSLSYLAIAYLGGIATVPGALVGGALVAGGLVFTTADRLFGLGRYQLVASGLGLVAVVVVAPDGIAGATQRWRGRRAPATTGPG